jgi:hypothetical protein
MYAAASRGNRSYSGPSELGAKLVAIVDAHARKKKFGESIYRWSRNQIRCHEIVWAVAGSGVDCAVDVAEPGGVFALLNPRFLKRVNRLTAPSCH